MCWVAVNKQLQATVRSQSNTRYIAAKQDFFIFLGYRVLHGKPQMFIGKFETELLTTSLGREWYSARPGGHWLRSCDHFCYTFSEPWHTVLNNVVVMAFYASGSMSFLIAFNRCTRFLCPSVCDLLFCPRNVRLICACVWCINWALVLFNVFYLSCPTMFQTDNYHYTPICDQVIIDRRND